MLPEADIDRQVPRQPAVPLLVGLEGHGVGPLPAKGLNESLRLAVDSWRVGPGTDVPEPQSVAGLGERLGDVGGWGRYRSSPAGTRSSGRCSRRSRG